MKMIPKDSNKLKAELLGGPSENEGPSEKEKGAARAKIAKLKEDQDRKFQAERQRLSDESYAEAKETLRKAGRLKGKRLARKVTRKAKIIFARKVRNGEMNQ